MSNPANFGEAGDSAELEALFDSIASTRSEPAPTAPAPAPAAPVVSAASALAAGDSDDLQEVGS